MKKKYCLLFACSFFIHVSYSQWIQTGNNIYNTNTGFVGIGVTNPVVKLDVNGSVQSRRIEFLDFNRGHYNGDRVRLYRDDPEGDYALLKLQLGDENQAEFQIGYVDHQSGKWVKNLSIHNNNVLQLGDNELDSRIVGRIGNNRTFGFHINRWGGKYEWTIGSKNGEISMMNLERNTNGRVLLAVNGGMHSKEINVNLNYPAPDYVFEESYELLPLKEVEAYIKKYRHLPEIPAGRILEKQGINVAEMEMGLLKKVEELTLYIIKMEKEIALIRQQCGSIKGKF
ncbi:hypothetical protein [Arenibacter palladensis]|uniref:hypothetical protein n=1 Tax=Arenibacter palladensis TaxID=237373 RepID=UPI001160D078|nr:hypothetical protein [Arenibacter palladensis]